MYDVIIIGAGPAGLTAAANTAHRGLKTLVLEQCEKPGGQPLNFYPDKIIKDHPGFPVGVLGKEFARLLEIQAKNADAKIKCGEEALSIEGAEPELTVRTTNGSYLAQRVIICTGLLSYPSRLPVLSNFTGTGVHYKIENLRDFRKKNVVVVGGGDNAFDTALQIKEVAGDVKVLVKHEYAKAKLSTINEVKDAGIEILYNTEIKEVVQDEGSKKLTGVRIVSKDGTVAQLPVDEVFSAIGFSLVSEFLKNNGLEMNTDGSIKVDGKYETSRKGVFAAGDVNGDVMLIAVACARGIEAAINSFSSIKKPYWLT